MSPVISALMSALRDLREPRMLALALVPPFAAIAVWAALTWAYADDCARLVTDWIATTHWIARITDLGLSFIFIWASTIAVSALLVPVMLITAVVVTGLVAMPVIVPLVGQRHFPQIARRKGGTLAGSLWNSVAATAVFAALWLLTLPLWLTGFGALAFPLLLSAYLNQRMFRYDALTEHATAGEFQAVVRGSRGRLFLLGLLLGALYFVPVFNLVVPVLSGLAFTHLCLGELARLRQTSVIRES